MFSFLFILFFRWLQFVHGSYDILSIFQAPKVIKFQCEGDDVQLCSQQFTLIKNILPVLFKSLCVISGFQQFLFELFNLGVLICNYFGCEWRCFVLTRRCFIDRKLFIIFRIKFIIFLICFILCSFKAVNELFQAFNSQSLALLIK